MKPTGSVIAIIALILPAVAMAQDVSPGGGQTDVAQQAGADAPQGPVNFVAIGIGTGPKYPGSDKYKLLPFVVADVTVRGVELSLRGPSLRANIIGNNSPFELGPVISFNFGRHQSDGGVARNLSRIGNEIDVGGYAGYHFGGNEIGQGQTAIEVTALQDVSKVSKGYTISANVSRVLVRTPRWNLGVDADITYASGKTLRKYFGVTPADALASGLSPYSPGSSVRDFGGGLTGGYQINSRWGLVSRLGYEYLVGDAAKSPIVKAGSRSQLLGALAVSYRF